MSGARLVARGLRKHFVGRDGRTVGVGGADGVDLTLEAGGLVVVAGGPASGRTSLLRCLAGTYRPDTGSVVVHVADGTVDLATADSRTVVWVRARELAMVDGPVAAPPRQSAVQAIARIARCEPAAALVALDRLGAGALAEVPVGRLRPSEAATVALVAALSKPASVILLDQLEGPAPGPAVSGAVSEWLHERTRHGAAVLVATGPTSSIERTADSVVTIERGELQCVTP